MTFKACKSCYGYCCICPEGFATYVTDAEVEDIAAYLDTSVENIKRDFIRHVDKSGRHVIKKGIDITGPCAFWSTGRCGIYPVRPEVCKKFQPMTWLIGVSCKDYHRARAGMI